MSNIEPKVISRGKNGGVEVTDLLIQPSNLAEEIAELSL